MRRLIRALQKRRDEYLVQLTLYAGALLIALCGVGFLAIAGYLALGEVLPLPLAALTAGAGMLLFSLLMIVTSRGWFKRRTPDLASGKSSKRLEAELGDMLGSEASSWVGKYGREASLAAFALGVASGFSPRLRRAMLGIAKDVKELLDDLPSRVGRDE